MGLDIKDVPKELFEKMKAQVDNDPRIQQLRIEQRLCQERGDYDRAMQIGMAIELAYNQNISESLRRSEEELENITIDALKMPEETRERILVLVTVMFMCADIIESAVIGVNDELHKYEKDVNFEMFWDMQEFMKMVELKLEYFNKETDYMKDLTWGNACDNLYEMMQSKSKSIIRKRENSKDWGKNMEKFFK